MGRDHFLIPTLHLFFSKECFETSAQDGAVREPDRQAPSHHWRDHIDLEFLAQLAVISAFGFFSLCDELFQLCLLWEGDAIDTRELLALLITAPVGTRNG